MTDTTHYAYSKEWFRELSDEAFLTYKAFLAYSEGSLETYVQQNFKAELDIRNARRLIEGKEPL